MGSSTPRATPAPGPPSATAPPASSPSVGQSRTRLARSARSYESSCTARARPRRPRSAHPAASAPSQVSPIRQRVWRLQAHRVQHRIDLLAERLAHLCVRPPPQPPAHVVVLPLRVRPPEHVQTRRIPELQLLVCQRAAGGRRAHVLQNLVTHLGVALLLAPGPLRHARKRP